MERESSSRPCAPVKWFKYCPSSTFQSSRKVVDRLFGSMDEHSEDDRPTFPIPTFNSSTGQDLHQIVSFMSLDHDHLVFRKFERLSLYHLLFQQHQLAALDHEIGECQRLKTPGKLAKILPVVGPLFKGYGESLLLQKKLHEISNTPPRSVSYLKEYSDRYLIELRNELDLGSGWSDLVSLATTQKGWIHKFINSNVKLQRLFQKDQNTPYVPDILLYSEEKVKRLEEFILNVGFSILVVGPIFILSYTEQKVVKLLIVVLSIFAASGISSIVPGISQAGGLALVAGYTAILVVFLSGNAGN